MGGVGKGSAKLILFGEHAAVYGHPAIGLSLPQTLTAHFGRKRLAAWDLEAIPGNDCERLRAVLARLETLLPGLSVAGPCSVRIDSDVPRGAGFGSSAALCSALALAAIEHAGGRPGMTRDAWGLAHDAERLFHGTPSGVDTGLSLLGGLFAFRPRPPGLPDCEELPGSPLWLVAAAVPRDEACDALIGSLGERMRAGDPVARGAIAALGRIAGSARDALAGECAGTATLIGALAEEAMKELRGIGLSTAWMDALLAVGMAAGALGGKLSGAGGGGAFYLVADSAESAGDIAAALRLEAERAAVPLLAPARIVTLPAGRRG